ncbi:MAG: DNA mismatch repair protein MutS [Deltaproteobacteria bacterium]|jgi:DNA mismatch repair protein MutS|nr:DNA mismatch repair protein MutS [Deltaproteobacteria bacterium]
MSSSVLLSAFGALLGYLRETVKDGGLSHLSEPKLLSERTCLGLDEAAVRNLELFKTLSGETSKATVLAQIDMTVTAMGARLLRQWLARPLVDREAIEGRHGAVEFLSSELLARQELTGLLTQGGDLEKALGRLSLGRGTLKDLHSVKQTLAAAPKVKSALLSSSSSRLSALGANMGLLEPLRRRLETILADLSLGTKDAPMVASSVSPVLDELRSLESGGKMEIASMEHRERRRTGMSSLKIGFNKIYGYYLEVSKRDLSSVPSDWIRKQTITGGERFVTEALKEWEEKVLTAGDKRKALENLIIENLKAATAREAPGLKSLASVLSETDALCSLAACAEARGWTRPKISPDDLIDIKGGRHPVVERFLPPGEAFVENDVLINHRERILIVTGPNRAGKSTVLRQTALIVILCQMGSFVPAASATLSIRDQVFTRVGASDDLARGRSTFMVEMSETARILKKATSSSLVILDEVGRGTSTFDGLAIAWAVAERLHDLGGRGVATLFATHYHELIELSRHKSMVRNYNVSVKRWGDSIVFLRKLAPGGVNRSYGLDVASLAGLPPQVVKRAREVLSDISRQGSGLIRPTQARGNLLTLAGIGQDGPRALAREIAGLKAEELTPMEALSLLAELRRRAQEVLS